MRGQVLPFVAALAVLFALLFLFGSTKPIILPDQLVSNYSVGLVGKGTGSIRHIPLGDLTLSFTSNVAPLAEVPGPVTIVRGVLSVDEYELKVSLTAEQLREIEGGRITFTVSDTNDLGILIVRLNGYIVWTGKPGKGSEVEIDLDSFSPLLTPGENLIKISTTSSGWRIWAPATYSLTNIKFEENVLRKSTHTFEFPLTREERDTLLLGRITFRVENSDPVTDLTIRVNDAIVWRGSPQSTTLPVIVDFSKSVTGAFDNNTLTLEAGKDSSYELKNMEIIVFTSQTTSGEPAVEFAVTQEQLNAMREGRLNGQVEFTVVKVVESGPLTANLNEAKLMDRTVPEGTVKLAFTADDVKEGTNTLAFGSSGIYAIEGASVSLIR